MSGELRSPAPVHRAGEELYGFRITRVTAVDELRATAYEAVHLRTGARFLHLHCADRENFYALCFKTPPSDSTGVPHILEHSVLAGSSRYPVKDAFTELGKGSLKTFINAFTAPDSTSYPVASLAKADFYNLAAVYTDLVFRPLLHKNTFMQEGHHLEIRPDGGLTISGIVYNEMKGALSTAEAVAERVTIQELFPDTPYGYESGGDPEVIPELTYEGFCEFHRRYYSPSNSRIFLYGDIPTVEHLKFLAGQLEGFERVEVDSQVPLQTPWKAPRQTTGTFPVGPEDAVEKRSIVNLAWMTAEAAEQEERLILEVLEEALVGTAASPLRKRLIDSGLGEDLSPTTGLEAWFRQAPFVVGLRNTEADRAGEIEALILDELTGISARGFGREQLEAAFHQVEFGGLEISRTPYLFPLRLMFRAMSNWLHDQDPLQPLRFPTLMGGLRERWQREPDLFARAVRRWLVDNPHRLRAVINPSRTLAGEREEAERRKLEARRAAMTSGEVEEIRAMAEGLLEDQRKGESREALASLPVLRLEEVPREAERIPSRFRPEGGAGILEQEIFSNGIAYLDLAFDVSAVPEDLQPYLPLLGAAATGMGAAGLGYEAMATRKSLYAGKIGSEQQARDRLRGEGTAQFFCLRGKALKRNVREMVRILRDIALEGDLSDSARLKDVLWESRNRLRARVAPQGHLFSRRSAAASLSLAGLRDEQWHGATQVRFLFRQAKDFEVSPAALQERLGRLRAFVFSARGLTVNLTGDADCLEALRGPVTELVRELAARDREAEQSGGGARSSDAPAGGAGQEAISQRPAVTLPGEVCYVSRVLPAPRFNEPGAAAALVLTSHLNNGVLYRKIRVEGGAYGGMAFYNAALGQMTMVSYRDPNLEKTLEVYDGCLDAFMEEPLTDDDVRKAVISTVAGLDRPMDPAAQGMTALERHASGLTDEDRQRFRDEVLRTDGPAMRQAAIEILKPALARARDAVYAPKERIDAANAILGRPFEVSGLE